MKSRLAMLKGRSTTPIIIGEHISHNHYRVSDAVAGQLARNAGGRLPAHGHELSVELPNGKHVWLTRTPTQYLPGYPKRGWVWCVYSTDRIE
jgi:hypothetical protein